MPFIRSMEMNTYQIWFNLKNTHRDLEFCEDISNFLGHLKSKGLIREFRLSRRKLGLGPPELGEFQLLIDVDDLVQLEKLFHQVAARDGETEKFHKIIYSSVTDFKAALYRDFPDPVRKARAAGPPAE